MFKSKMLPLAGLLALAACNSNSFKTSPDGLEYKFFTENKSDRKPAAGDMLTLHFIVKNDKDSVLDDSHKLSKLDSLMKRPVQPRTVELQKPSFKGGLESGLMMMSEGDSAEFKLPVDSLYKGGPVPPMLKAGTKMAFVVKLLKIVKSTELKQKEEKTIDSTLNANKVASQRTASGLRYVITSQGTGQKPNNGDVVSVHHKVTLLNDTVTVVNSFGKRSMQFPLGNAAQMGLPPFYDEAIALLPYGGRGVFYVPSSLAFGGKGIQGLIPPNSMLTAEIGVLTAEEGKAEAEKVAKEEAEMQKNQQEAMGKQKKIDDQVIKDYIKKEKLSGVEKTASGIYYLVTKKGNGAKPTAGQKVSVQYRGTLLDGKEFDASKGKAFEFTIGQREVIAGWDEAIALLNEGSKATLLIPSGLAYGPGGAGNDIAPNSVLRFDVELVKVSK
ncbi:FKBP-type peptidyl-prolyl cis-trans isomerase [Flexibacter flexilis]|nr:FKBP-type peptidyl-prolyl cis-trans isomerase [Flexibacter flexilis]